MLEIRRIHHEATIAYSGDVFNTAVYLIRAAKQLAVETEVSFLTGIGDDQESALMRQRWADESVLDQALVVDGAQPGLYMIHIGSGGERTFLYWRSDSAAARMFRTEAWLKRISGDLVFLSGITMQLMTPTVRIALVDRLRHLRQTGTKVAVDSNYRPAGWSSPESARAAIDAVLAVTDVALVTLKDEVALGSATDLASCVEHLRKLGIREIVVKDGEVGSFLAEAPTYGSTHVPAEPVDAVDTTAAGDAFNGAYLAARLGDADPITAARLGNRLAREVVGHSGAIIDRTAMPILSLTTPI